jgi:serine/threonine-protein kinase
VWSWTLNAARKVVATDDDSRRQADLDPGRLIAGRYRIESQLGRGAYGVVYLARDIKTEWLVALKVLSPSVLDRANLELETKVSGRVGSEHIVVVRDAGIDDITGCGYVAMERLKGCNLEQLVEERGVLDAEDTVEFLRQVASGLDRAHSCTDEYGTLTPIVHRDLKPENVFLTHREDGKPLLKILDYGIAKLLTPSRPTASVSLRGTPAYMAPEQVMQGDVSPATDVWALGLVAFYLLRGKPYWQAVLGAEFNSLFSLLGRVQKGPTTPPSTLVPNLQGANGSLSEFDSWFFKCVNPEPGQRFQRASDAVRELAKALGVEVPRSPAAKLVETLPVAAESIGEQSPRKSESTLTCPPTAPTAPGVAVTGEIAGSPYAALPSRRSRKQVLLALTAAGVVGMGVVGWWPLGPSLAHRASEPSPVAPSRSAVVVASSPVLSSMAAETAPADVASSAPAVVVSARIPPTITRVPPPKELDSSVVGPRPVASADSAPHALGPPGDAGIGRKPPVDLGLQGYLPGRSQDAGTPNLALEGYAK